MAHSPPQTSCCTAHDTQWRHRQVPHFCRMAHTHTHTHTHISRGAGKGRTQTHSNQTLIRVSLMMTASTMLGSIMRLLFDLRSVSWLIQDTRVETDITQSSLQR